MIEVLGVRAAVDPKAVPSPNPCTPTARAARTGTAKPAGEPVRIPPAYLQSRRNSPISPTAKRTTIPTWSIPPVKPTFTRRSEEPCIVSTKNQKKIPSANAAAYFAEANLPKRYTSVKPRKAGTAVAAVQAAKLDGK